jgi:hypothetical protein
VGSGRRPATRWVLLLAPAPRSSLGLRPGGGWVRVSVRGRHGRAPWPAGLEESLAAALGTVAVADRGWRGETAGRRRLGGG